MAMVGMPRTQFHLLNRAYMLMNHRTMPGHERHTVNMAKLGFTHTGLASQALLVPQ